MFLASSLSENKPKIRILRRDGLFCNVCPLEDSFDLWAIGTNWCKWPSI